MKRVKQHLVKTGAAIARGARKTTGHAVRLREKSIIPVHNHLVGRISWYKKWHEFRWYNHIHVSILLLYVIGAAVVLLYFARAAQASSTWTQSTWDGGSGTSTSNQYDSVSSIDASAASQLLLSRGSNLFTNSTLDSSIVGWNGFGNSHDTSQGYSTSSSAKITAPAVSTQHFTQTYIYDSGSTYPASQDGGDINGDGREDLVVGHYGNSSANVSYAITNSDGTLGSFTTLNGQATNVMDVRAADLNNDGYADIVVSYWTAQYISVFLNTGSGGFTTSSTYVVLNGSGGIRQCGIDIGRINNDSYLDLAVTCSGIPSLYTFTNTGSGTFNGAANVMALTNTPGALNIGLRPAFGDLNGDGVDEIVIPAYTVCNFDYFTNDGLGTLSKQNVTLTTCGTSGMQNYTADIFDIDNDGKGDILLPRLTGTGGTGTGLNSLTIFKGSSGGIGSQSDTSESATAIGNAQRLDHSDVNGDGYQDFVVAGNSSSIRVFMKNGNSTFTRQSDPLSAISTIRGFTFIDIDGNGKKDLATGLFANSTTSTVYVLRNNSQGGTLTQPINIGNTNIHQLEAYVYKDGTQVTSSDAELYSNGRTLTTSFSATGTAGWYKLSAKITGVNAKLGYGVLAKQGKTIYVDNMSLYKYASTGTLTSAIYDPGYGGEWGTISYTTTLSPNVTVKVRTSNSASMSGATAFSSCPAITSGADISGNSCVSDGHRYIQYQVSMTPNSGDTPVFSNFTLNYAAYDIVPPSVNATDTIMYKVDGGTQVGLGEWTNGSSPYFEWTAAEDNAGGAGILGYCLYLGQDNTANPVTTKGMLGTSPISNPACPFIVSSASIDLATAGILGTQLSTSNSSYYLRIKAVDIVGNVFAGSAEQFDFKFDNTPPTNPAYISGPSGFINTKSATFTWPTVGGQAAADANSGLIGLQYRFNSGNWYGDNHTGSGDINDLLVNDGIYTTTDPASPDVDDIVEGVNTIYFRSWDEAGNVTTSYASAALKVNTNGSPSEPQGLVASPPTNTVNEFAFSWSAPSSYVGSSSNLTYCYTVNVVPSSGSCTWTAAGVTSVPTGAFATQPGTNTFYVVARDESNNVNYSSYASQNFSANTAAPGIPQNIDVADVSVKTTSNWRLAVTWDVPASVGAGVAAYRVYRSASYGGPYNQVGSSSSTSYVDTSLSQVEYFYKVKACDSANNCGSESGIVSDTPTGKFTSPALLVSEPTVSNITTRRATIDWSTDRASDSKIAIGTESGSYSPSEIGNSDQTTDHTLDLDNLAAGTTYYYKAKWTDEDGNTGQSQEYTFTTSPAPVLKEVVTQSVRLDSAEVQFTVKDAAKVDVLFGKSDAFGGIKTLNTSTSESTYQLPLTGLDDGTKYFYRITMYDSEGGQYASSIFSFTTPQRPRISNLNFQPVEGEPTSTQKVTWTTNVSATTQVIYSKVGGITTEVSESVLKTEHEIIIRGLDDNSEYTLVAQSRDSNSNLAVSDRQVFRTALDTRPPKIFDIAVESVVRGSGSEARGQIIVTWKTDEPSTSQVQFSAGVSSTELNNQTVEDGAYTTDHIAIISDLSPSRSYNVRPVGADRSGNRGTGGTQSTIIGRATDSVISIIFNTLQKLFGFSAQ